MKEHFREPREVLLPLAVPSCPPIPLEGCPTAKNLKLTRQRDRNGVSLQD
jgi:hypothetical protein